MEKYGTDLSVIPPSDDQLRQIKKLASQGDIPIDQVKNPENSQEANEIIDHLAEFSKKATK